MKRLGKLVIMTDKEHFCLVTQLEMANGYKDVAVADLRKAEAARDNAIAVARRFHAAGGYSHTLPKLKEELRQAQGQVSRYRPIGEIFQPSEALTTLLQDVNGVSDCDAAADFEIVGNQVRRERATP